MSMSISLTRSNTARAFFTPPWTSHSANGSTRRRISRDIGGSSRSTCVTSRRRNGAPRLPMGTPEPHQNAARLHGKTALVTGASRGVGNGIARGLAGQGARVYITGRTGEDLRHIEPIGTPIQCDHRTDEEVDAAFDRISGESGGLDILVNNVWGG